MLCCSLQSTTPCTTMRILLALAMLLWSIPWKIPEHLPSRRGLIGHISEILTGCSGDPLIALNQLYTLKKGYKFSCSQPGCDLPKISLAGNNLIISGRDSLVSDIPAGDWKTANLFFTVQLSKYLTPNSSPHVIFKTNFNRFLTFSSNSYTSLKSSKKTGS